MTGSKIDEGEAAKKRAPKKRKNKGGGVIIRELLPLELLVCANSL